MAHSCEAWDERDLARRLCRVLDFAARAIAALAEDGSAPGDPDDAVRPEKVIAETALLLFVAQAACHWPEVRERVDAVARQLNPYARGARMRAGVCLEPALALDYGQAHLCLSRIGHTDATFDALLQLASASQAGAARERPQHRLLEQEWLRMAWSPASRCSPATLRGSAIGRPLDLLSAGRDDIYAFTHSLMYVTDFGNIRPRLPRPGAVIFAEAEAALANCLDDEDYDLAGEILLAWPMSGRRWSALATFAFGVLARVEDEAGILPAPTTRVDRMNQLAGAERERYMLATAYHTIYVMGLLCATALRPGRAPPRQIPVGRQRPGATARWLKRLDGDARPHWWDSFALLSAREQDGLVEMLFGIALRHSVRGRRFGVTEQLLRQGYAEGLADRPLASQAAELLQRLAVLNEFDGLVFAEHGVQRAGPTDDNRGNSQTSRRDGGDHVRRDGNPGAESFKSPP